jgi:hypothetical protein
MVPLINYENNKSVVHWFNDITSISNHPVSEANQDTWRDYILGSYEEDRSLNWFGVNNGIAGVRDAVELRGWEYGVKHGEKTLGVLPVPKLPSIKRRKTRGSSGSALDIHRVYSGDLSKAWESTRREISLNKFSNKGHVNIIIDVGGNCGTSAESMFWRGAAGSLLTKALIASGRNVRVIAVATVVGSVDTEYEKYQFNNLTTALVVKDFNQYLDLNSLFACTAMAGFFRYYGFKSILSQKRKCLGNLGRAVTVNVDSLDYYMDGSTSILIENIWSEYDAKQRISHLLSLVEQGKSLSHDQEDA